MNLTLPNDSQKIVAMLREAATGFQGGAFKSSAWRKVIAYMEETQKQKN